MKLSLLEDDNGFKDYNVNEHYRYVGFVSEIQVGKYNFFQLWTEVRKVSISLLLT
jgi:hypothetical protein